MWENCREFNRVIRKVGKVPWLYEGTLGFLSVFREVKKNARYVQGTVLDVGCGRAPYRHVFPHTSRYLGIDTQLCGSDADVQAECASLPFKDCQFDSVLLLEVLEHLPEAGLALEEIFRVMKDGAYLLISVPQTIEIHGGPHDFYRYTRFGLKHVLGKNGFETIYLHERGGFFLSWFQEVAHFLMGTRHKMKIKILDPVFVLMGTVAQVMGLGLDKIFYYPDHTFGYYCVAQKPPFLHQCENRIHEKALLCFEKIKYHGYTKGNRSIKLYFAAMEKIPENYRLFLHCYPVNRASVPPDRKERGFINMDHEPGVPTSCWVENRVYSDSVDLSTLAAGKYTLRFGFFNKSRRMSIPGCGENSVAIEGVSI